MMLSPVLVAAILAAFAPLATMAQTQNPVFLSNSGVVVAPTAGSTLKTDGSVLEIEYNGIAADGFESSRLEMYLLTVANGYAPSGFGSGIVGYERFGALAPLASLPPNSYQNDSTEAMLASNTPNAYRYNITLPRNTQAGQIPANLTFLEFYHSPDDQGMVWVSLNYHPVNVDASA